jgi:GNAT superfamily N-acetyltransferase
LEKQTLIVLRPYIESDAPVVGRLIADTFGAYNLREFTPEARNALLGPFLHARSPEPEHRAAIAEALRAEIVIVAVETRPPPLNPPPTADASLHDRAGIGRRLPGRGEGEMPPLTPRRPLPLQTAVGCARGEEEGLSPGGEISFPESMVVGVLRGRPDKLQSLFVRADRHRQGIGRRLVEAYEAQCRAAGSGVIKVQATLYAVPFYRRMGYRRSTGMRQMRIFDGARFPYQPMKKVLGGEETRA